MDHALLCSSTAVEGKRSDYHSGHGLAPQHALVVHARRGSTRSTRARRASYPKLTDFPTGGIGRPASPETRYKNASYFFPLERSSSSSLLIQAVLIGIISSSKPLALPHTQTPRQHAITARGSRIPAGLYACQPYRTPNREPPQSRPPRQRP